MIWHYITQFLIAVLGGTLGGLSEGIKKAVKILKEK